MHHEFAIYTVEDGLQVVPLAGVLAVKQLQNADHEGLVNIFLGRFGVRVLAHHVPKQELVYYLHFPTNPNTSFSAIPIVPATQCTECEEKLHNSAWLASYLLHLV